LIGYIISTSTEPLARD